MKINHLVTLLSLLAPSICNGKRDTTEQLASIRPGKVPIGSPRAGSLRNRASNADNFQDASNAGERESIITMTPFFSDGVIPSKITVQFFQDESAKVFHSVSKRKMDTGTDVQGNGRKEYFWSGEDDDLNQNSLNLLINYDTDEVFRVTGSASIDTKVYNIITGEDGSIQVHQVPISILPEEGGSNRMKGKDRMLEATERDHLGMFGPEDDGSVIDVMCMYTPAALCDEVQFLVRRTGVECDQSNSEYQNIMREKCQLGIEETNVSYQASGINTRLNLVHSDIIGLNYVESHYDMCNLLDDFRDSDIEVYRNIRNLRNTYRADLVITMLADSKYCGCGDAYDSGNASAAYSVVNISCSTGYYSFGHEIGHALGCEHNRDTYSTGYEYGYQDSEEAFRTVMSYDCPNKSCTRVQRYSTPNSSVKIDGRQVGNYLHDNVRKINENRVTIANFRRSSEEYPLEESTSNSSGVTGQYSSNNNASSQSTATGNILGPPIQTAPIEIECMWNNALLVVEIETPPSTDSLLWTLTTQSGEVKAPTNSSSSINTVSAALSGNTIHTTKTCIPSGMCYSLTFYQPSTSVNAKYRFKANIFKQSETDGSDPVFSLQDTNKSSAVTSTHQVQARYVRGQKQLNFSLDSVNRKYW
eukprot:CAMPEP_0194118214 /NCGR_PEP_ID=MMETSP0150-20130528/34523_1 /TAXON_ID=122233 /ORGANISM="Chaetoceros debilis, Strain MM31A-1" /LENGTH=642 /DNA_ID=CAMNT_0038809521 /DNA_START=51 /DNA_END=1976 /DNA_ORIENTATION=+